MYTRALFVSLLALSLPAMGAVLTFGDQDCLGFSCYGASDPKAGATLQGLAPGLVTLATNAFGHGFPFTPGVGEFLNTDQIFVGSVQTGSHDGYSGAAGRLNGPQTFTLDYSSLVPAGETILDLTLGISADDFQFPALGQPFLASVNGAPNTPLTNELNALNQTGPTVQFFSIGLSPSVDPGTHILTVSINQGGDGGDGWAVDFLTVGVTTTASGVPEPGSVFLTASGLAIAVLSVRRRLTRRQRRAAE
jgi:hypothetical protein